MKIKKHFIKTPKKLYQSTSLLILLHGYGSNASDLFSFIEDLPESILIVSLEAPIMLSSGGFSWYEINFLDKENFNNLEQIKCSENLIIEFIKEKLRNKYIFDENNIWLCGFSQGAILSYSLLINHPNIFKKAVCLSGFFDEKTYNKVNLCKNYPNLEFFISHGLYDQVIPIEWIRKSLITLKKLPLKITYKEYASEHTVNRENYEDMINWIKKRI